VWEREKERGATTARGFLQLQIRQDIKRRCTYKVQKHNQVGNTFSCTYLPDVCSSLSSLAFIYPPFSHSRAFHFTSYFHYPLRKRGSAELWQIDFFPRWKNLSRALKRGEPSQSSPSINYWWRKAKPGLLIDSQKDFDETETQTHHFHLRFAICNARARARASSRIIFEKVLLTSTSLIIRHQLKAHKESIDRKLIKKRFPRIDSFLGNILHARKLGRYLALP